MDRMTATWLRSNFRFRWTFASLLTLNIALLIIALVAVATLLDIRSRRAILQDGLRQQALVLGDTLRRVMADPLYNLDIDALDDMSKLVRGQHNVERIQFASRFWSTFSRVSRGFMQYLEASYITSKHLQVG